MFNATNLDFSVRPPAQPQQARGARVCIRRTITPRSPVTIKSVLGPQGAFMQREVFSRLCLAALIGPRRFRMIAVRMVCSGFGYGSKCMCPCRGGSNLSDWARYTFAPASNTPHTRTPGRYANSNSRDRLTASRLLEAA